MGIRVFLRNWVPLASSFINSSTSNRINALKEVSLVLILSLIPIWGGALHNVALLSSHDSNFFESLNSLIGNGELILYSTSILAPIFYLVISDPVGENHYPHRYSQGLIVIVLLVISLLLFSAQRTNPNTDYIFKWSVVIFIISIVLLYLATVFRNWASDGNIFKEAEQDFTTQYRKRRAEK